MRYIFVDLGGYDGDSLNTFMMRKGLPKPSGEFEIYVFEPNPRFTEFWLSQPVNFSSSVAWIKDGMVEFSIDLTQTPLGSSVMKSKKTFHSGHIVELPCFDFSNWVRQFKDDYLIVKMDVEGAEFPILEKMINDGTLIYMNQLWVEMHPNKVADYTTTDAHNLMELVKQVIYVEEWH